MAAPPPAPVTIENDHLALTFDGGSGLLASVTTKATGVSTAVSQSFCFYEASAGYQDGNHKGQNQPSGAYIFRPAQSGAAPCVPVAPSSSSSSVITDVITGPIVSEVRQTFSDWLTQTVRLGAGDAHAEFEWTVGPVPLYDDQGTTRRGVRRVRQTAIDAKGPREPANDANCTAAIEPKRSGYCECVDGRTVALSSCGHEQFTCADQCKFFKGREVVSKFVTPIKSAGALLTDSNGREMQARQFNKRPTWALNQTEEVAGNYYPVNAAAAVRDAETQLTLLTDRSQGGASLRDGELELMVHRRLLTTAPPRRAAHETQFTRPYALAATSPATPTTWVTRLLGAARHGGSTTARPRRPRLDYLTLSAPATAAAAWRPHADRVFAPPCCRSRRRRRRVRRSARRCARRCRRTSSSRRSSR